MKEIQWVQKLENCPYCGDPEEDSERTCTHCSFPLKGDLEEKENFIKNQKRTLNHFTTLEFLAWHARVPMVMLGALFAAISSPPDYALDPSIHWPYLITGGIFVVLFPLSFYKPLESFFCSALLTLGSLYYFNLHYHLSGFAVGTLAFFTICSLFGFGVQWKLSMQQKKFIYPSNWKKTRFFLSILKKLQEIQVAKNQGPQAANPKEKFFRCPYCGGKTYLSDEDCPKCHYPFHLPEQKRDQFVRDMLNKVKEAEKFSIRMWLGRVPIFLTFLLIVVVPEKSASAPELPGQNFQENFFPLLSLLFVILGIFSFSFPTLIFSLCLFLQPLFLILITNGGIPASGFFMLILFMALLLYALNASRKLRQIESEGLFFPKYYGGHVYSLYHPFQDTGAEGG